MTQEAIQRMIEQTEAHKEFVTLENGFVYFWPENHPHGCYSSWHLRVLADELDRRNSGWDRQVRDALEALDKTQPTTADLMKDVTI